MNQKRAFNSITTSLEVGEGSRSESDVKVRLQQSWVGIEIQIPATALYRKKVELIEGNIRNIFLDRADAEAMLEKFPYLKDSNELRDVMLVGTITAIEPRYQFSHIRDLHLDDGFYKCPECGFKTVCKQTFNLHPGDCSMKRLEDTIEAAKPGPYSGTSR